MATNHIRTLAEECDVRVGYAYSATISTEAGGAIIDTAGFGGVAFLLRISAVGGSSATYQLKQSDASNMADATTQFFGSSTIESVSAATTAVIDVPQVEKRYVQLFITGVGGNAAASAMAVLYNGTSNPVTQTASATVYR